MSTKIAVITGSSSGIGLLTAVELAKSGFQVIATMRDLARREKLEQAASTAGVRPYIDIRRLDVTEFDLIPPFVEKVVRDHGRIDVLVNNAGFAVAGFAEDLTVGEIRSQFETNFFGAFSISSYSASKFALEGWSESLRMELNSLGIKVVLVEPGSYETDIWTRNARIARKTLDGTSPNRERGHKMRDRIQALPKRDPIIVARAIVRIVQDPNPRLRYVLGPDAHIQLWLKRVLPWKWHEKLVARLLKVD
jgi:NAD(P)-dependent dehydrogenase (short-subunit alcohol dehydrogenase family)